MPYKIAGLIVGATLCCAFAFEPSSQGAREIAQSVKTGEPASSARPPYGLPLYPGSHVHVSMMDGMALGITVGAGAKDLEKFYSAALTERGYLIDEVGTKEGRRTIHASERRDPSSKMAVSISPNVKDASKFTLVFMKLRTP